MRGTLLLSTALAAATIAVDCPANDGAGTLDTSSARTARSRPVGLMPRAITSFGADALGGWLYVLGGYHGTPHEYSREGQSREFYRVNVRDMRDIQLLPNEERMQSVAMVADGERLYRIGGMKVRNAEGEDADMWSTAEFAAFDPVGRTWTELADLPDERSSHQAVVVGDTLYVVGGWKLSGDAESGVFHETYLTRELGDPSAEWVEHEAPFRRRALALAGTSRHVVVVGGMQDDGSPCRLVDVLDTTTGEWTSGPELPGSGFAASAAAVGDVVYASGREGELWRLDLGTVPLAWASAGELSFPRFFHELVAVSETELVALGVIFIPMLLDGPGPAGVDRRIPEPPDRRFESRLLPVDPDSPAADSRPDEDSRAEGAPDGTGDAAPVAERPRPSDTSRVTPRPRPSRPAPVEADSDSTADSAAAATTEPAETQRPAVPAARSSGDWVLQLGSFGNAANAARLVDRVSAEGYQAFQDRVAVGDQVLYRVRVGYWPGQAAASAAGEALGVLLGDLDISVRQLEERPAEAPAPVRGWMVQVGSFSSEDNAVSLRDRLRAAGFPALMEAVTSGGTVSYRVRVGPEIERGDAEGVRDRLRESMGLNGIVVSHP